MQKLYFILTSLGLIFGLERLTFAQSLHHQTLSAMGSQSFSLTSGLLVQQSIGQSSVTGGKYAVVDHTIAFFFDPFSY